MERILRIGTNDIYRPATAGRSRESVQKVTDTRRKEYFDRRVQNGT
jgi:hypothetical protein